MPRGGRRPGAGAKKGNFNAVRSGNHSPRMALVYLRLLTDTEPLVVARAIYEAGFLPPPSHQFNNDLRGVTEFLWHYYFDSSQPVQSKAIKGNQSDPPADAAEAASQIQPGLGDAAIDQPARDPRENE